MSIIKELRTRLKQYVGPVRVRSNKGWVYVRGSKLFGEFTPEEESKLKELGLAVSPRLAVIGPTEIQAVMKRLNKLTKGGHNVTRAKGDQS